jgi:hypothetical protein
MRVYRGLLILAALVVTPFIVGAAQGRGQKVRPQNDESSCTPEQAAAVARARAAGRPIPAGLDKKNCEAPVPPAPPPSPVPPPVPPPPPVPAPPPPPPGPSCGNGVVDQGTASINGGVFTDGWVAPLPGWCVELSGPVTTSALTDASGNYSFVGLPDGVYTVCQVVKPEGFGSWVQTFPRDGAACLVGLGYTFGVEQGSTYWFNDFTYRP